MLGKMGSGPTITSRRALYDFLDSYTESRRSEIDKRQLGKDVGLLKSYIVETSVNNGQPNITQSIQSDSVYASEQGEDIVQINYGQGIFGYAEVLTNRHFVVHSYVQNDLADTVMQRVIRESSLLDSLWLAGGAFSQLLYRLIEPNSPHRSISVKFEYNYRFSSISGDHDHDPSLMADISRDDTPDDSDSFEEAIENRWAVSFVERARRLSSNLTEYQRINPHWKSIRMLRIPAQKQGGFDLWNWGKMTHRGASFREGNNYLRYVSEVYEKSTRSIEELAWLSAEPVNVGSDSRHSIKGFPVVFNFQNELSDAVFSNFISLTFDSGGGPFRLWGNPIHLGERKVHVYGMDLHLWQKIYMEFTPKYFLFLLPKGTCGNTIHRMVANIQRFIDPAVQASIGGNDYEDFISAAMSNTAMTVS